jgi:hypothetical protein
MSIGLALLVSADPTTIQQFSCALREFSLSPDVCQEVPTALRLLEQQKFDAVIVDLQLGENSGSILDRVRLSLSNRTAVTFAISGNDSESSVAFRKTSGFVFERPLSEQSIRRTLQPAYGLILRERRRYFRCPASVPVQIVRQTMSRILCESVNISEGGMALSTSVPFIPGEQVRLQFTLPGQKEMLLAKATICWWKTGHLGLRFASLPQEQKSELQSWLSLELEALLPGSVVGQFQKERRSAPMVREPD